MKKKQTAQSAFLSLCISFGMLVFLAGIVLALFAATDLQPSVRYRTPPIGSSYISPSRAQLLRMVMFMKRGLLGIMEPAMATMKPGRRRQSRLQRQQPQHQQEAQPARQASGC